ncbi:hypothetical protein [Natronosalvus vescus]|uniref:hypothetical protein n=1 Tax=Natronosalvus vescus TaxID=2953881 RepID=UPI002090EBE9|nr:hypothetical protein [Natronosalvus vescus]
MPSINTFSRRTLVGAGLGGVGALLTGSIAWNQYARRNYLTVPTLSARNASEEPVTLTVDVGIDLEEPRTSTHRLEAAGLEDGANETYITGPWIKRARLWAIRAVAGEETLVLSNSELNDRANTRWGADAIEVTIVVTADGGLESEVAAVE